MQINNLNAEAYCLGAALKSLDSAILVCDSLDADHFYSTKNRILFTLIRSLIDENKEVSTNSVFSLGTSTNTFNDMTYLSEITFDEHRTSEVPTHIAILAEMKKSRLYLATVKAALSSAEQSLKLDDQIETHLVNLEQILAESNRSSIKKIDVILDEPFKTSNLKYFDFVREKIDLHSKGIHKLTGISTGFNNLDDATDGLQPSWLYVFGARPSEGKSQFIINILNNIALQKVPSLFFSLEMPASDVLSELLSINGEYDHKKMQEGTCSPFDIGKLHYSCDLVKQLPIYIDDQASLNTTQMKIRIKAAIRKYGIKVVFIDYLQEVTAIGKFGNHQEKMQAVSRDIREMAKDFDIPIICAAQVNRESEKSEKITPPMAAHLRESGQIEQCAWFIGMLHRPDKYDELTRKGVLELYIRKNRFGIRKKLEFNYFPNFPNYSYKITELKGVKDEIDTVRDSNKTAKNYWEAFE